MCEACVSIAVGLEGMWVLLTFDLVIELLLTAAFVFSVFMIATEKHKVCDP